MNEKSLHTIVASGLPERETGLHDPGNSATALHCNPLLIFEMADRDVVQVFVSFNDWPKWYGLARKRRAIFVDVELEDRRIILRR